MKKGEIIAQFREYTRNLSPKPEEQYLISLLYNAFNDFLDKDRCIQIGSYPRFTAITPTHDLDLLYVLGDWDENNHTPQKALQKLSTDLGTKFTNPTQYDMNISTQSHSVTVVFAKGDEEMLSVDIVPAYKFKKNCYGQDRYKVPEILKVKNHKDWGHYYEKLIAENQEMQWINSDPRGYIKLASDTDSASGGDFRKATKFIKKWKNNLADFDEELKLKSFHLEQVMIGIFEEDSDIFDAIYKFYFRLPVIIDNPNVIRDRASNEKFIDDYLTKFTEAQKAKIKMARDGFLKKLENWSEETSVEELLVIDSLERTSLTEEYLFDQGIPVLTEEIITICGWIQQKSGVSRRLNAAGLIDSGYHIKFVVDSGVDADMYKWKVKNDDKCTEPRGEITDHQTRNHPEHTKYKGVHFVECFAIRNNVCIARASQKVWLPK